MKLRFLAPVLLLTLWPVRAADLTQVYERVRDSVVVIQTTQRGYDPSFGRQQVQFEGIGSGVLIREDGRIVTAAHVVQTADEIQVAFASGEAIPARVVGSEPAADLALIQLEQVPRQATVAPLGDSDGAKVGDEVFVVGAPMGMSHTLTVGHISARRQTEQLFGGMLPTEQFQTDAAINQGNSGGPMFNMQGEVIGIVSYIISQSGGFEGLGFVITSNMARSLLIERQSMWSGMQGRELSGTLAHIFNVPQENGVLVELVSADSPAEKLGLQPGSVVATILDESIITGGDIILETMGISLDDPESYSKIRQRLSSLAPGDLLEVTVLRGGKIVRLRHAYESPPSGPAAGGRP